MPPWLPSCVCCGRAVAWRWPTSTRRTARFTTRTPRAFTTWASSAAPWPTWLGRPDSPTSSSEPPLRSCTTIGVIPSSAPRPQTLNAIRRTERGHLSSWLDEEDPDVPGDVADDERAEGHARRVQRAPMSAGDPRRAEQREVAGDDVDAAVGHGCERGSAPAPIAPHQGLLDETAPEELLGRTDDRGQPGRDLRSAPDGPERVDVPDLRVATRDEASGKRITHPERRIQRGGRGEPERDLGRSDPRPAGRSAGRQCERPERQAGQGHPLPEPVARSAERRGKCRLGRHQPNRERPRRDPVPASRPVNHR